MQTLTLPWATVGSSKEEGDVFVAPAPPASAPDWDTGSPDS